MPSVDFVDRFSTWHPFPPTPALLHHSTGPMVSHTITVTASHPGAVSRLPNSSPRQELPQLALVGVIVKKALLRQVHDCTLLCLPCVTTTMNAKTTTARCTGGCLHVSTVVPRQYLPKQTPRGLDVQRGGAPAQGLTSCHLQVCAVSVI